MIYMYIFDQIIYKLLIKYYLPELQKTPIYVLACVIMILELPVTLNTVQHIWCSVTPATG